MKIVDCKTFLAYPEGTLFQKYTENATGVFADLCVKYDSISGFDGNLMDFFYLPLTSSEIIDSSETDEWMQIIEDAEKGKPFEIDLNCMSRDAMFDTKARFVVWEKKEIDALIGVLGKCIGVDR